MEKRIWVDWLNPLHWWNAVVFAFIGLTRGAEEAIRWKFQDVPLPETIARMEPLYRAIHKIPLLQLLTEEEKAAVEDFACRSYQHKAFVQQLQDREALLKQYGHLLRKRKVRVAAYLAASRVNYLRRMRTDTLFDVMLKLMEGEALTPEDELLLEGYGEQGPEYRADVDRFRDPVRRAQWLEEITALDLDDHEQAMYRQAADESWAEIEKYINRRNSYAI